MVKLTAEEVQKKLEELEKCVGDECQKSEERYTELQKQFDALKSERLGGVAPPQDQVPEQVKQLVKECVGEECKQIREEELPRQMEEYHIKKNEEFREENPEAYKRYMQSFGYEEEGIEEEEQEDEGDVYCWECSRDLPEGQFVRYGEKGCCHGKKEV